MVFGGRTQRTRTLQTLLRPYFPLPGESTQIPGLGATELPGGVGGRHPANALLAVAVIQRQRSIQAQGPQGLQARPVKMGDDNAIGATGQKHRTAVARICRREAGESANI